MLRTLAGLATLGLMAAPALGADPIGGTLGPLAYPKAPSVQGSFDWSGFYAGVSGSYTVGNAATTATVSDITTNVPFNGPTLGATVGANWQSGVAVFGVEGDLAWSGVSGTTPCILAIGFSCNAEMDWIGTIRGRAGVGFDNLLVFATGGIAIGHGRGTITPDFPGLTNVYEDTFVGWTIGAGAELAVSETISIKAQYEYTDLGTRIAPVGTLHTMETTSISPTFHTVKLGVNFHF